MKRIVSALALLAALLAPVEALAICGDVNGDGERKASDALAVLRASVGQPVDLVCEDSGPSRLRYYNDLSCAQGSSVSEARFNSFTFTADGGETSEYQVVDRTQIDSIEVDICGGTYTFPGPLNLPPNRSLTFLVLILDANIYGTGDGTPAQFVIYDDGAPASTLTGSIDGYGNVAAFGFGVKTSPR